MVFLLMFAVVVVGIWVSLQHLWYVLGKDSRFFSVANLLLLINIYGTILLSFGLIYISLEFLGVPILYEHGEPLGDSPFHLIEVCLYFSAITLLSVGYGDIVPLEIGRWIAIIEALIGYVMPAAFISHSIFENEKK